MHTHTLDLKASHNPIHHHHHHPPTDKVEANTSTSSRRAANGGVPRCQGPSLAAPTRSPHREIGRPKPQQAPAGHSASAAASGVGPGAHWPALYGASSESGPGSLGAGSQSLQQQLLQRQRQRYQGQGQGQGQGQVGQGRPRLFGPPGSTSSCWGGTGQRQYQYHHSQQHHQLWLLRGATGEFTKSNSSSSASSSPRTSSSLKPERHQHRQARGDTSSTTTKSSAMPSKVLPEVPDYGRSQAKQSALAKLAVMNGNRASLSPDLAAITSHPKAKNGDEAQAATIAVTAATPAPVSHPKPTSNPHANHLHQDALLPPPAIPSMAHALRSLSDINSSIALRDHKPWGGAAATDTPPNLRSVASTAPNSPRIAPKRQNSASTTPRVRGHATTLNVPGMTRSRASPDGRIPDRDVAAKMVIIMVGLPARGKSYITKKLQRYLSWMQHNSRIFNVGNRRRLAAGMAPPTKGSYAPSITRFDHPAAAASILLNGNPAPSAANSGEPESLDLNDEQKDPGMDQTANFFEPTNERASAIREQVALETLDELLDYLLVGKGSVGILDATNSTIHRRQLLVDHIKARDDRLGILFIESICHDKDLLEANMRLKLSGPDYRDKDPVKSLEDFKKRVAAYESAYEPIGAHEEANDMQYIQLIDVGRKVIQHRLRGFLSGGISSYLTTFNLAPRQIWLTRHGQSIDNGLGKLGGDSELTPAGRQYGEDLHTFISFKRKEWLIDQKTKIAQSSFPPLPGDHTPPYPEINQELDEKNFCVWTSMLQRSVQTADAFEADDEYDVKNWEMLNELNSGLFEGMTYEQIARDYPGEYEKRSRDKLHYVYPGVGGEGYLQVIARLRDMVREIERIQDHICIIGHRSVCRVLMAYFMDLQREDIADLDVPLGMLYAIEPKPYGMEFHAYRYNQEKRTFDELPGYKPRRTVDRSA